MPTVHTTQQCGERKQTTARSSICNAEFLSIFVTTLCCSSNLYGREHDDVYDATVISSVGSGVAEERESIVISVFVLDTDTVHAAPC